MTPPREDERLEPDDEEPDDRDLDDAWAWQIAQDRFERWLDEIGGSR